MKLRCELCAARRARRVAETKARDFEIKAERRLLKLRQLVQVAVEPNLGPGPMHCFQLLLKFDSWTANSNPNGFADFVAEVAGKAVMKHIHASRYTSAQRTK